MDSQDDDVYREGVELVTRVLRCLDLRVPHTDSTLYPLQFASLQHIRSFSELRGSPCTTDLPQAAPEHNQTTLTSRSSTPESTRSRASSLSCESSLKDSVSNGSSAIDDDEIAELPTPRECLSRVLKDLAPKVTLETFSEVLERIPYHCTELEGLQFFESVRCPCPPTGQTMGKCWRCQRQICKDCGYDILQTCGLKERNIPSAACRHFLRKDSMAARRIQSYCTRHHWMPATIRPGRCLCTEMLMDETYESKTGELCQECLPGILGTLDRENVAEKFLVTAQPWDKNFWQYLCACGRVADDSREHHCIFCQRACIPYALNEKWEHQEHDTKSPYHGVVRETWRLREPVRGSGWQYSEENTGTCPYFYIPGLKVSNLKTVKELEVIAEEANKSFDVMDLDRAALFDNRWDSPHDV